MHRRGATLSNEAVPNACRHNPIDLMSAQGCEQKAEEQTWKAERNLDTLCFHKSPTMARQACLILIPLFRYLRPGNFKY